MNTDTILLATFGGAILTVLLLWLRDDRDDIEAGVALGRSEDSHAQPDLIACQCQTCLKIRCVDRRWLPESIVHLPTGCRVSNGVCPSCERRAHAELDAIESAVTPLAKILKASPKGVRC